jgi:hypothetical protein
LVSTMLKRTTSMMQQPVLPQNNGFYVNKPKPIRPSNSRPVHKVTIDLLKTYKNINTVFLYFFHLIK